MNPKIQKTERGFDWRDFPGFSIIFDNGEFNYKDNLLSNNAEKSLVFYKSLYAAFSDFAIKNKLLSDSEKFLPLDFSSWHVTVWDGINRGNFKNLGKQSSFFSRFMKTLKYRDLHPEIRSLIEKSIKWINKAGPINFSFRKIYNYNNEVLVVSLKPADLSSLDRLHKIKFIRSNLNNYFEENFGFATSGRYLPHVSLGYFVTNDAGEKFNAYIQALNDNLAGALDGKVLSFSSAALFSFKNMVTFFKST